MNDFLKIDEIPIGSWWSIAQGGDFGYTIIGKNSVTNYVDVLGTDGVTRKIDAFKLQYKYKRVIPNRE